MSLAIHDDIVPALTRALTQLRHVLQKGQTHAEANGWDPAVLLGMRLAPDMIPLTRQVQIATDFAKGCGARLAGVAVPAYDDSEQSFAELKARIVKTIAFLESLPPADIDGSETRAITTGSGEKTKHFTGQTYLFHYALPHFFFHATTAYNILRHNGLDIGKKNFIGSY